MKKLLYMALVFATAFAFTSCDKESELDEGDDTAPEVVVNYSGNYVGDMVVSISNYGVSTVLSTSTDVSYYAVIGNESVSISMYEIQFVSAMPALDIVLPNVPELTSGTYCYQANTIVPTTTDGEPYDTTTLESIEDVNIIINTSDSTIEVSYYCTISTTTYGDMVCLVEFTGAK